MSVKFGDAVLFGLISSSFFLLEEARDFALIFQREKDNWARNFKRLKEADAVRVFPMDCQ